MLRTALTLVLGSVLSCGTSLLGQTGANTQAERIRRYERMGSGGDAIMEATLDLTRHTAQPAEAVVRVCSREPMPLALALAAMSPFKVAKWMHEVYNYPLEHVVFSRAEDCLGSNRGVAAAELWAVPKGATPPASVESIRSSQARLEPVGTKDLSPKGVQRYRAAAQDLAAKLKAKPGAVGIVLGYYYRQPTPSMERKLREVRKVLETSRLAQDRYYVRLAEWTGEYGDDDPEPKYPSMLIVEVARDNARR